MPGQFGARRIYYNNFGEHLLNRYNPNMTHPDAPNRWSDADWAGTIDMVADFGFNVWEFWLAPRLFCREGLDSEYGREFVRRMRAAAEAAHRRGMKVLWLGILTTTGDDWRTLCPHRPEQWAEVRLLWEAWCRKLDFVDIVSFFPGDPGGCSLNGCTAETYIDGCLEIARLVRGILPRAEFEIGTWGPPFFGWGVMEYPEGREGTFNPELQITGWRYDRERTRKAMEHLIARLPEFPGETAVAINLGFDLDGRPGGERDARDWARQIAAAAPVYSWDFSLTEGENGILPHYRFRRLFEQRRSERAVGAYSGGICFTMTPWLNQLSLYEAARSFLDPDADCDAVAREFYERVFGAGAGVIAEDLPLFEIVPEWGNYERIAIPRNEFHRRMERLRRRAASWEGRIAGTLAVYPSAEYHRAELEFFSRWMRDVSAPDPDYQALHDEYFRRVYRIYHDLPEHVDPRPEISTRHMVDFFRQWR